MSDLESDDFDKIIDPERLAKKITPDAKYSEFDENFENKIQLDRAKEEINSLKIDNKLREKFAPYIYWFVVAWIGLIFIMIFINGWCLFGFKLSDTALLGVIIGNTTTIIGMLLTIVRYLFPTKR